MTVADLLAKIGFGKVPAEEPENTESLAAYAGTYLGFAPTDESAVVLGEIELIITSEKVAVKMATGLQIETNALNVSEFVPMTRAEVEAQFKADSTSAAKMVGFTTRTGHPKMLFLKEA